MQQSKQLRIIGFITLIVVIALVGTIVLKTKGIMLEAETSSSRTIEKTKVTILTSDVVADQSWGSLAYKGQLKIEEQFPVNVTLYSEVNTEKLMFQTIKKAIQDGSKLIIGHGREFSEVFATSALTNPDVRFVTIHGTAKYPNQTVYTFDQGEIEYFAGLAAALKTKTNRVGVINPTKSGDEYPEFETGLAYYKPEVSIYTKVVGSRDDGKKAVELMKELLAEGVDVIYSKGNSYNRDVIDLAKKENVYVIGYLDDQSYMGKEHVLTSVMNDVSQTYVAIMNDFFSEKGMNSGKVILNESHGVYSLAPFGPMFTEKEIQFIKKEMKKYDRRELMFP
ncbi:basic membrane lipoprotein [Bacillus sp. SA1-12]|uniref:BMP family ABC transporter substrate-binding protein n=1 Tax=Bacillus sp. SA1-12 TaxID=1455638 RepID=UPI0006273E3A|nr:BMP family ABC transporter substrate-binding protein [Bacillus sp. SA1-12]KKI89175.1 basic membrane lipoprotein [Bacillus sp. SA1-12]